MAKYFCVGSEIAPLAGAASFRGRGVNGSDIVVLEEQLDFDVALDARGSVTIADVGIEFADTY